MARKSARDVSRGTSRFEIEPLLSGTLILTLENSVSFHCKVSELSAVIDSRVFNNLISGLQAVGVKSASRAGNSLQASLLLASKQLPKIRGDSVGMFHQAQVISASPSLARVMPSTQVCVTVFQDVADPEVLFRFLNPPEVRFNSDLPKLKLKTVATEFTVISEPFVINESWGYNPVIEVEVPSGDRYYISPNRSLRDIFEGGRRTKDPSAPPTIVGNMYRVWKKSESQQAGFDGFEIKQFTRPADRSKALVGTAKVIQSPGARTPNSTIRERSRGRSVKVRASRPDVCSRCQKRLQPFFILCPANDDLSKECEYFDR